jgi:hypothetical protein
MAIHLENFVSVRTVFPLVSERRSRMQVADPETATERDYRDLLSEANLNFFHRETTIALQNYKALRHKILVQSHPEMPKTPGGWSIVGSEWAKVDPRRLFELGRRTLAKTPPGGPVMASLADERVINAGEVAVNPAFQRFSTLGLDAKLLSRTEIEGVRGRARELVATGQLEQAVKVYAEAGSQASELGDLRLAAQLAGESAAMRATYATGGRRVSALKDAAVELGKVEQLYSRLGDDKGLATTRANRSQIEAELAGQPARAGIPAEQTARTLLLADAAGWKSAVSVLAEAAAPAAAQRQVGLFAADGVKTISLDSAGYQSSLLNAVYQPRIAATTLEGLSFHELIDVNFVAYYVHLYFFVLPVAIGDCYLALGMYQNALTEYQAVLPYPFLNLGIESPYVWRKIANVFLEQGNSLFRRDMPAAAKARYEQIVRTDLTLPAGSPLYQGSSFATMKAAAGEAIKELKGEAHGAYNPKVGEIVLQAFMRLRSIAQGFNFFGMGPDEAPIFRFKYLQSVATYLADNAIEAERTFISYRSTAESQKIDRMQLESAVDINRAALKIEQKRLEDSALEVVAAAQTRAYSQLRAQHAQDALDEWNTKGQELTSLNAALAWASNAANDQDITYTNVRYDGASHDYEGDVEDFFDTVGEKREWLNWEMQRNRLERQRSEGTAEVAIAQTREQQALVRQELQQLNVALQQKRLESSQEILEYTQDRMFDEDLWFQLAAELQDLARYYLDTAIYSALLMERAYELELDRRLDRIRLDYGIGGPGGLLGGDHLKRDIISFTADYLEHAQKKNPVRVLLSLREEYPGAFEGFIRTGILPFRTDLEMFDRRFPGTYRRKLKKIEVFVEGLVPLEGVVGVLINQGITSDWRLVGGVWKKLTRVLPAERMVLSSYQFRRDLSVFQPSEEQLGLFENLGLQCNWTLEVPRSANNLDYDAISDIKVAFYFDADHSESLATFLKTFYSAAGGRSTVLSARFQFPDRYFRLDADRRLEFALDPGFFAYNYDAPRLGAFGVRLLPKNGAPLAGVPLGVRRGSDNAVVAGVTDAQGTFAGAAADMAPFGDWKDDSPVDTFTVELGDGVDSTAIADIQLFFSYAFTYRPNGVLSA